MNEEPHRVVVDDMNVLVWAQTDDPGGAQRLVGHICLKGKERV